MPIVRTVFRCTSVAVGVFAVVVGAVLGSGKMGMLTFVDAWKDSRGNTRPKGCVPFIHPRPWPFNHSQIPALDGKTIIVTGANAGLGYWTAYHLANKGAHVVLGCRSTSSCDAAIQKLKASLPAGGKGSFESLIMDLSSLNSVKEAAVKFKSTHTSLDSVILNAGIMRTPFGLTVDGIEQQIGVNHFGHALLVRELQDTLIQTAAKKQEPTTIVVVASASHYDTYPEGLRLTLPLLNDQKTYESGMAYGQSKLANVLFAQELSKRLQAQNVLVNAIHPGIVKTELGRHVFEQWQATMPAFVWNGVYGFLDWLTDQAIWPPSDACLTEIYAAVSPEVKSKGITGKYFHPIARETKPDIVHAVNPTLQTGLWKLTEEVLSKYDTKPAAPKPK